VLKLNNCPVELVTQNKNPVKVSLLQIRSANEVEVTEATAYTRPASCGCLIINADDWGCDDRTTNRILECFRRRVLSSASGMVFMDDSERAANIAREQSLDIGLHLNLSAPFSASAVPTRLATHHQKIRECLCANRVARVLYHPGLAESFEYAVACQLEEFSRLYGRMPDRIDGHHHMHLSANVLLQRLLPRGTIVRRHFSYEPGEKILRNSVVRLFSSALLGRQYRVTDFLFALPPVAPPMRIQRIFNLAQSFVVEVETHPINPEEYRFLTEEDVPRWTNDCPPARSFGNAFARQHVEDGS
jgi:chitin disaccharide deacetylase